MRKDEIRAAEQILSYFGSRIPYEKTSYTPGEDPPDAYLNVGNETYALEITSTEVARQPIFGEDSIREFTYMHSHRRILKDVEREAIEAGELHGKYVVTFFKPIATNDFSSHRSFFKSRLLERLKELSSAPVGSDRTIDLDYTELAWVYKLSDKGAKLYDVFEDDATTESPEFKEFVRNLILCAIKKKFDKVLPVADPAESVLAIIDTYGLAGPQTIVHACEDLQELSWFHTVIMLHGKHTLILHSKRADWFVGDA